MISRKLKNINMTLVAIVFYIDIGRQDNYYISNIIVRK